MAIDHLRKTPLAESLGKYEGWMIDSITRPKWTSAGRVHDWRNHVPNRIKLMWDDVSFEARLALIISAEEKADSEEWD